MKPIAWIGSNWKGTPSEESYLVWEKPHPADDPEPIALFSESSVQSLQAERDRLREALKESLDWMETVEPEIYRMDGGDNFDGAPIAIARKALES